MFASIATMVLLGLAAAWGLAVFTLANRGFVTEKTLRLATLVVMVLLLLSQR
jgi:hypothetical protein